MHKSDKDSQKRKIKTRTKKTGRPRKLLAQLTPAYRKRIKSGKAKGMSRSQSYGHPREMEISANTIRSSIPTFPQLSTLIKSFAVAERMKQGESLTQAAKKEKTSVTTLKRWMEKLGFIRFDANKKRYLAADTLASLEVYMKPDAIKRLIVDKTTASQLAGYLNTVMKAIKNNDEKLLDKYTRLVVRDVRGKSYRLVTDIDTLIVLERERKRRITESQKDAGRQHRISERVEIGGNLAFSA